MAEKFCVFTELNMTWLGELVRGSTRPDNWSFSIRHISQGLLDGCKRGRFSEYAVSCCYCSLQDVLRPAVAQPVVLEAFAFSPTNIAIFRRTDHPPHSAPYVSPPNLAQQLDDASLDIVGLSSR